jgi:hypothetical protein
MSPSYSEIGVRSEDNTLAEELPTPGLVMRLAKPLETVTTSEHMAASAK